MKQKTNGHPQAGASARDSNDRPHGEAPDHIDAKSYIMSSQGWIAPEAAGRYIGRDLFSLLQKKGRWRRGRSCQSGPELTALFGVKLHHTERGSVWKGEWLFGEPENPELTSCHTKLKRIWAARDRIVALQERHCRQIHVLYNAERRLISRAIASLSRTCPEFQAALAMRQNAENEPRHGLAAFMLDPWEAPDAAQLLE